MIRDYMHAGIAQFDNLQILNFKTTFNEVFVHNGTVLLANLGKNARKIKMSVVPSIPIHRTVSGDYFYWYTTPLMNYYHCINDGLGPIYNYLQLKEQNPKLKFMLNPDPRTIAVHPPFVTELLDLLNIEYEFSDENCLYEHVYFSDTLVQDVSGKRCRPSAGVYEMADKLIQVSRSLYPDVPHHDKVYLSRRAHANPLNDRKTVIGEDNTIKRGITNEDDLVDILTGLGYTEVFGENYNLGEKISMFSHMTKYISTAGAGVTNILWRMGQTLSVGGIHTPGFPFPSKSHNRHIVVGAPWMDGVDISLYSGKVLFVDPAAGLQDYNNPWYVDNLEKFKSWAASI